MSDEKKTKAQLIALLDELRGKLATGEPGLRYPAFCDNLPFGLFRCTRRGEILWANRTLAGMLGYEAPDGLTGVKLRSLFVHPRLRRDLFDRLKTGEGSEGYLAELKRSDGGTFQARLTVQTYPRAGENAEVFDGCVCDLTGEREFEEAQERRIKESAVLAALSRELCAAETVQEVLDVAVERLAEVFPAYSSVNLVEDGGRYLTVRAHRVESRVLRFSEKITGQRFTNWRIPLYEDSVISETIRTGQPTVCGLDFEPGEPVVETDLRTLVEAMFEKKSPLLRFGAEIAEMVGDAAFLGIPFTDSDGEVTGSITVLSNIPFGPDGYNLIKVSADIVGKALEQKRLSQELSESLERYRGVFEHGVLGMYRTSPDGRILMANPAMVRMLGYDTFEELAKRDLEEDYQASYSREDFKRAVEEKGEIRGMESVWTRLDGTSLHARENVRALRDKNGKTLYYEGTVEDITERKRAEEIIKNERDKAQKYLDVAGVILVVIGSDQKVQLINAKGCEILGCSEEDIVGKNWFDNFLPKAIRKQVKAVFDQLMTGKIEPGEYYENPIVTKSGAERVIAWHNSILKNNGDIIGILSSGSDITERKRAEEKLRASRDYLDRILNGMYEGLTVVDRHYKIQSVNQCFIEQYGGTREEVIGHYCYEVTHRSPEPCREPEHPCPLKFVFEKGEPFRTDHVHTDHNGNEHILEISSFPLFDSDGNVESMAEITHDITERKRAEEDRDKHLREIQALFGGVDILLWSVREGADGKLHYEQVNDAFAAVEGHTPDHYNGKPIADLHSTEECEKIRNSFNWAKLGQIHTSEAHFGEGVDQRFFEIRIIPLTDPDGKIRGFIGAGSDITERKRAEKALVDSERRYRFLVENTYDMFYRVNLHDESYDYLSPAVEKNIGYEVAEFMEMAKTGELAKRIHPDDLAMLKEDAEALRDNGRGALENPVIEYRLRHKDGDYRWLSDARKVVFDEAGKATTIIGVSRDITERMRAVEALRKSEEFNRAVIERSPFGVSVRNRYGRLLSCNETWRRIWAVPEKMITEELTGEREELRFDERDDYLSEWHDDIRRIYEEGGYLHIPEAELQQPREGGARWVSQHFYAIKDERGEVDRVVIVTEDITDRKDTQKVLTASEETYRSLYETTLALADETELTDVIAVIADQATALVKAFDCTVYRTDPERGVLKSIYSNDPMEKDQIMSFEVPLGEGIAGRVAQTGKLANINFDDEDDYAIHIPGTDEETDKKQSVLSVPMFDGKSVIGVLTVSKLDEIFTEDDVEKMGIFARQAEIAMLRAENLRALAASEKTYHSLYETTLALADETDLSRVIEVIAKSASNLLDSRKCIIFLVDEDRQILRPIYTTREDYTLEQLEMQIGEGLSGHVVETGIGMFVNPGDPDKALSRHIPGTDEEATERESLISVPMFDAMKVLGVITIGRFDAHFAAEDLTKLTVYARQAEIAVKLARHAEVLAKSEETYRSLYNTTSALANETNPLEVIRIIADQATALVKANDCTVYRTDPERGVLKSIYSNDPLEKNQIMSFEIPLGEGISGRVAQTGKLANINFDDKDDYAIHVPGTDEETDKKESVLSVPMFDGKSVIGVLTVNKLDEVFTQDDIEKMGIFARQAEIEMLQAENLRALAESEETYHGLYNTTLTLAGETDLHAIVAVICDQATKQLDSTYCTYFTYDAFDEVLILFYSNAPRDRELIMVFKVPLGVGLSGMVAQNRRGRYSNYTDSDRPVEHVKDTDKDVGAIESVISEPVMDGGTLLGVITIGTEKKVYDNEDLVKLRIFARLASIAVKRARNLTALEQSEETYRTLYETTMTLADETDLDKVLAAIADNARELMDAHFCNILSYDPEDKVLAPIYTNAPDAHEAILSSRIPLGEGLCGLVAKKRRGAYSNYCDEDRPVVHIEGTDDSEEHRESILAEPIMDGSTLLGVFLIHVLDRVFTDDDLAKVRVFARLTSIALKRGQYTRALSESEAKYRSLVEQATDGVVIIQNTRLIFANTAMLHMSGYESEEMINRDFLDFIAEEDRTKLGDLYEKRARGEEIPSIYEITGLKKDGKRIPLELNAGLISYDGAPAELVIVRDITERKRAEEALRESEERYRSIWTKSPVGICLSDRDGMLTMLNPVLRQMLGFSEEELIGKTFFDLLAPGGDDGQAVSLLGGKFDTQVYKEELSLFSGKPTEMALVKKSGERLPVEVTIDFITREGSVQYMISLITDITERKEAEEKSANYSADLEQEVDVKTAELSAARRYLREVIDASADLITVVDARGRIEILNRAASTAMGYGEEELRGKSIEILYFDCDRETFKEMTRRLSEGGPSVVRQVDLRCKDGSPITVELSVSPLLDDEGNFTGSVAVGRDIRELEGLRRALLQSEKLAATGKLAANIAHEVNNPLGIITNYLQIAKQDLDESSNSYRMVGIIEEEVQRIAQIISGLLDFYRPESSFLAVADVNQLIEDLLILVSIQLEKMGISVVKELDEDLPSILVSPDQFRQVLLNLVTNAQDAMPDGGTLFIRTRRSDERVVLSLSDTGEGIPAENLPYIFDPFFTTKGKEGTGLGLSVSYGIVQSFDGMMEASSRPGEGTTITISLPAQED